jgi:ssRNA-specific RNase YbeY (16S rRNA maturation enzyme)
MKKVIPFLNFEFYFWIEPLKYPTAKNISTAYFPLSFLIFHFSFLHFLNYDHQHGPSSSPLRADERDR